MVDVWARAPSIWEISRDGRALRIGQKTCALADIVSVVQREEVEGNISGQITAAVVMIGLGVLFILPVVMTIAEPKFLIGGALFVGIGITALLDLRQACPIRLQIVDIGLRDGTSLRLTTARPAEAQGLLETLAWIGRQHLAVA
ncbi:MAG: DUF6232 family protein [Hyphomicrobiaceae bacterium]